MSSHTKNVIIGIAGLAIVAGAIWTNQNKKVENGNEVLNIREQETPQVQMAKYRDEALGVSFEYRIEPDGYTLMEEEIPVNEYGLIKLISLTDTRDYQEFISSDIPREGPLSISVGVYDNFSSLTVKDWVYTWPRLSTVDLALSPVMDADIKGKPAITYTADGLYPHDKYIVSHKGKILIFSGSYNSLQDQIKKDFDEFLKSIEFL